MFVNSLCLVLFIIFSFIIFLINNLYLISLLLLITMFLCLIFKIKLPIIKTFITFIILNFLLNYLFSTLDNALMVSMRLIIMFLGVNILHKKINFTTIGPIIGYIFHNEKVSLIISIALSFIPIMIKEISDIKKCLIVKNYSFTFHNILKNPSVFIITFINNLFSKINDMEKVLISRGLSDE